MYIFLFILIAAAVHFPSFTDAECSQVYTNTPTFMDCQYRCHCNSDTQCDPQTGHCENGCKLGWMGPGCQYRNIVKSRSHFGNVGTTDNSAEYANKAIDGDIQTCSKTNPENESGNQWWRIEWSREYLLKGLVLKLHSDDLDDFRNFRVETGNGSTDADFTTVCYQHTDSPAFEEMEIMCQQPLRARHLRIILDTPDVPLRLCEVEIYGGRQTSFNTETDQLSTFGSFNSFRSVDGHDLSQFAGSNVEAATQETCSATQPTENNPWWYVNLGRKFEIQDVYFYGRRDKKEQFQGYIISVGNSSDVTTEIYRDDGTGTAVDAYQPKMTQLQNTEIGQFIQVKRELDRGILTICEVLVFADCPVNECGWNCSIPCYCEGDVTGNMKFEGSCPNGCLSGWTGNNGTCDTECANRTYGLNCSENCGHCFEEQLCDHVTGYCPDGCAAGYIGNFCNDECTNATYGINCTSVCGFCWSNSSCNNVNGSCENGCLDGWRGDLCLDVCKNGTYGSNCSNECGNCLGSAVCDHVTGYCEDGCEEGYTGHRCLDDCENGTYGYNCSGKCGNCLGPNTCDHVTGHCHDSCKPGYLGIMCKDECEKMTYGENCSGKCGNCLGLLTCNHITGQCDNGCGPGYIGNKCLDVCSNGTYGAQCSNMCGQCLINANCDHVSGICKNGCYEGWKGDLCLDECDNGQYGRNCQERCGHCQDISDCNTNNGYCLTGCAAGWNGSLCDKNCDTGTYGLGCLNICGNCRTTHCTYTTGACPFGCSDGFMGDLCISKVSDAPPGQPIAAIVGSIVAVLIAIAIGIAAVFIYKRRQNWQSKKKNSNEGNTFANPQALWTRESTQKETSQRVTISKTSVQETTSARNNDPVYWNNQNKGSAIPASQLRSVRNTAKRNPSALFSEFQTLPYGLQYDASVAKNRCHITKNRYKDMYPYNFNRVILPAYPGDEEGTTYINASHINGYNTPGKYIAAQGAIEATVNDIWRMVWSEGITVIVMLTRCHELGRMKCFQYWSDEGSFEYGDITTDITSVEKFTDFEIRTFVCFKTDSRERRTVLQFHYTAWPDKDVPDNALTLAQFWRTVRKNDIAKKTPWLIHCSAGVGRTGTFIALDYLYDQGVSEGKVDIKNVVYTLREQRLNMVQMKLHEVVAEVLDPIGSVCKTDEFSRVYDKLIANRRRNEEALFDEYKKICENMDTDNQLVGDVVYGNITNRPLMDAQRSENIHKSRNLDIIPADIYRPRMCMAVEGGNDFINSVFVPTFRQRDSMILTQLPLEDTVVDFIRMVWEFGVKTVVLLEEDVPENERYWPTQRTIKSFGPFKAELLDDVNENVYILRTIRYSCRGKTEQKVVRQFHFTAWHKHSVTPVNTEAVMDLLSNIVTIPGDSDCPLVIQCLDGAMKCGLLCVLWCVLERMKTDNDVAIAETVRLVRLRRKQVIDNFEQYQFCYRTIWDYLESHNVYANVL